MNELTETRNEIARRRTFAIISHPDAGKTTLTEKLLLFSGAIQLAGTVKGRKTGRHAASDWMALEKQRGISVSTSVMQFLYQDKIINLLDTPGHEDFSEDTYRTLTAVDSALMVIDAVKGVEERTIKLLDVCRMRKTPVMTFINKLDRESRPPLELLDEIESVLKIQCAPVTWPVGSGKLFKGVYHLQENAVYLYQSGQNSRLQEIHKISLEDYRQRHPEQNYVNTQFEHEIALIKGAGNAFDRAQYLNGALTPVFFGSAMNNFGVRELLNAFADSAPPPLPRPAINRIVMPQEDNFSGFVFKIQANMDPQHRDRMAFLRICSGKYEKNMKIYHVRLNKEIQLNQALTFMASERGQAEYAYAGDIIGLHNHGTIQIGDAFTSKSLKNETLKFTGIPHFAPELFRRVRLKNPLKSKALLKGLMQLSEEGAAQLFRPLNSNDLILGAVGALQFDVVAYRLQYEYSAECIYDPVNIYTVRWVEAKDRKMLDLFKQKSFDHLALDINNALTYLAPSRINLGLILERFPDIEFHDIREH